MELERERRNRIYLGAQVDQMGDSEGRGKGDSQVWETGRVVEIFRDAAV